MTATPLFRLYLWSHRVLYLGISPDNELHRHHAAQLCVSLDGPMRYRADADSSWSIGQGFLIPPDQPHQFDTGTARILALYLEPESDDYPFSKSTGVVQPLSPTDENLNALRSLIDSRVEADEVWSMCASTFQLQRDRRDRSMENDSRVQAVVAQIRRQPDHAFTARELAEAVHLSPSRLSHIFKSRVGIPIRRFIVWSRLRTVIKHALRGASLTQAAHAAGFSDAAHMSNAFRGMFGFAPSALFGSDIPKEVIIVE
jgi:AraC-like DNA-binding protein